MLHFREFLECKDLKEQLIYTIGAVSCNKHSAHLDLLKYAFVKALVSQNLLCWTSKHAHLVTSPRGNKRKLVSLIIITNLTTFYECLKTTEYMNFSPWPKYAAYAANGDMSIILGNERCLTS